MGKEAQRLITIQQPQACDGSWGDRLWHYFREPHPCPQVKLKQISPRTEEEKTEHSVAAERRRMRLVYADTIKDLLANCAIQYGEWLGTGRAAGAPLVPWAPLGRGRRGISLGCLPTGGLRPGWPSCLKASFREKGVPLAQLPAARGKRFVSHKTCLGL